MKTKIIPIILIIIFVIIFFIFYKGLQTSNIYTPNNITKKDIPYFKVKIFDTNDDISSKDIFKSNKFYLMNIWASWCLPCRAEHTYLMKLSEKKNIEIIGLNYKDDNKKAKNFLAELGNPYRLIFSDKDGLIAIEWGAYGVPESFLIYENKIILKFIGPLTEKSFNEIQKFTQ